MVAMFYSVGSFFVGSNSASSCLSTHANNTMDELMQVRGEGEHAGVCCIDDYIREVCQKFQILNGMDQFGCSVYLYEVINQQELPTKNVQQ